MEKREQCETGLMIHQCRCYLLAPLTGNKEGCKERMVVRVGPTPIQYPVSTISSPMDSARGVGWDIFIYWLGGLENNAGLSDLPKDDTLPGRAVN